MAYACLPTRVSHGAVGTQDAQARRRNVHSRENAPSRSRSSSAGLGASTQRRTLPHMHMHTTSNPPAGCPGTGRGGAPLPRQGAPPRTQRNTNRNSRTPTGRQAGRRHRYLHTRVHTALPCLGAQSLPFIFGARAAMGQRHGSPARKSRYSAAHTCTTNTTQTSGPLPSYLAPMGGWVNA